MPRPCSSHGSVIAFEGPHDIIATQLRLLPNSPNVLTIPSLDHFLDSPAASSNDDLRSTILHIHAATAKRADVAKLFLGDATSENRKLVFLNGGTASAVVRCIAAIRSHYINTTVEEAEFIYHELVRNGVAGLERARFRDQALNSALISSKECCAELVDSVDEDEGPLDDPISRAMKAADALDRETESLQPSTELDLTTGSRARSMSLPMRRVPEEFENAAPFYVFGAPEGSRSLLPEDAQRSIARDLELIDLCERSNSQEARSVALRTLQSLERSLGAAGVEPRSPSCAGEPYQPVTPRIGEPFLSPTTNFGSLPASPAFIGQAQVYDVRHSYGPSGPGLARVKSLDRIYATSIRNQDIALCRYTKGDAAESNPESKHNIASVEEEVSNRSERPILRSKYYSEIPRATYAKPTRTTIKRGPPSPLILGAACRRPVTYNDQSTTTTVTYVDHSTETERNYVDRGVDAMEPHLLEFGPSGSQDLPSDAVFEVVIPMLENLVIHFSGEKSNPLLESIIHGLQDGSYPISLPPLLDENDEEVASSRSSNSSRDSRRGSSDGRHYSMSNSTVPTSLFPQNADEYDPYASHGDYLQHSEPIWDTTGKGSHEEPRTIVPIASISPQPRQKTPSLNSDPTERSFHDFDTTECRTAVGMQNSLRSILNIYFPPDDGGFDNYNFPSLPEMSGLWKPVFRDSDSTSSRSRNSKIDLILAIGAQKGVERNFLSTISGSLEKLGTKSNGITRSGRLDLRYLIASAMQTFTSQPLANQTKDNPFTNSLLLATLIIPFLELYMAAHTDTRFLLLEYPPEHLTTVLALQRLIGIDLLKVAGIIDAEAGEPKPFPGFKTQPPLRSRHSAGQSISCMSITSTTSVSTTATLLAPGMRNTEAPSFSRANFILTSLATESEIATLISTIWKLLVDISSFYIPEGAPRIHAARRVSGDPRIKRVSSDLAPRSTTPLIDSSVQYAPLASAAIMLGFARPDKGTDIPSLPINSEELPDTDSNTSDPSPPLKSVRGSITETIRSSKTLRTMSSQKKKIRSIMLGRDLEVDPVPSRPETMNGSFFELSDDEDGRFAADERKYMPLFGRTTLPRKGNSRKALKWLGLSVEQ